MRFLRKITILPILVFAAFLAFSVRLVDVVSGAAALNSAFAETHEEAVPPEMSHDEPSMVSEPEKAMPVSEGDSKELQIQDDTMPKEEISAPPEVDVPKWMDATDSDSDGAAVRMELLDDLVKRRQALEQREKELMTREALVRATETELDQKLVQLQKLRGEIEALLETQSEEEKARTASLVKIYEGMKPKDAARIFDTLDLDILVSVVGEMSERKLSPILASMNPERARTLTIMLAEQKQLPVLPEN